MKRYIKAEELPTPEDAFSANASRRADIAETTDDQNLIEMYAYDPSGEVREAVEKNPNTPGELLRELAKAKDGRGLYVLANPNTPEDVLRSAYNSGDCSGPARALLASNPNLPEDILVHMSSILQDYYNMAYDLVAINPNTPKDIAEKFLNDPYIQRKLAVGNRYRTTPPEILDRLARSEDREVRKSVAYNSDTPASALDYLASDEVEKVRFNVARNFNTALSTILSMVRTEASQEVLEEIYYKYRKNKDVMLAMAKSEAPFARWRAAQCFGEFREVLDICANDQSKDVRRCAAANPGTPSDILDQLSYDDDYGVRVRVAENRNTSIETLERLSHDSDPHVRVAAEAFLDV